MISARLITRATLDGVAQTYETGVLPTNPDAGVLWDAVQVSCGDTMGPPVMSVVPGSVLHHWLVLDAIQSAESVPQGAEGKAAIEAVRAWLADPCERTRIAASDAAHAANVAVNATHGIASANAAYSAYAAAYAAAVTDTLSAAYAAYNLGVHASYAAAYVTDDIAYASQNAINARVAAQRRFRVLATMATAGVLPAPERVSPSDA